MNANEFLRMLSEAPADAGIYVWTEFRAVEPDYYAVTSVEPFDTEYDGTVMRLGTEPGNLVRAGEAASFANNFPDDMPVARETRDYIGRDSSEMVETAWVNNNIVYVR